MITILAGVAAYLGINFLKGINLFKAENEYYLRLDNLGGIGTASPILIKGYKVGSVRAVDFSYDEKEGYSALLTLSLDPKVKIPRGSTAKVKTNMLSGAELIISSDSIGEGLYTAGDTLPSVYEGKDIIAMASEDILPEVMRLLPEITKTMTRLNEIVSHPGIDSSLVNLHASTIELQAMMRRVNASTRELPAVMNNVSQMTASMATVGRNVENIRLDSVVNNLNLATENLRLISEQLRSGEGTAGKLLYDPALYHRLDSVAASTEALMKDLKANPKRYVRFSLF